MSVSSKVEIVVVEDSPSDIELLMRVFKKHNVLNNVVFLKDGEEALGYFKSIKNGNGNGIKPKLVLLDLKLPKVGGVEVLKKIKSDKITKEIPVIILTGSQEDRDLKDSYDSGVTDYIIKPLTFKDLAKVASNLGMRWILVD